MNTILKFTAVSLFAGALFTTVHPLYAQTGALPARDSGLVFSGYIEAYYAYDFGQPADHNRPGFVYTYKRHNEVALNLGLIKASYNKDRVRANLALMTGSYANDNLAAEPGVLKNIYEANAGIRISKRKAIWIDAGVFSSHIGFESAVGKDCWTLTRSILADNSPYFESGAKITYNSDNGKWLISGLVLNGWQRMQRADGNNTPAFRHQLTFSPNNRITINSSSFVGSDSPDSVRKMRYFHDLYGIFELSRHIALIAGIDIGAQQKAKGSSHYNTWYAPVIIARYKTGHGHSLAARVEYYSDANGVIIDTGTPHGFKTWGYSLNYDYLICKNVIWRLEARGFTSEDALFKKGDSPSENNFFMTTALAVSF